VTVLANIQAVRPGMPAFLVSAKTGEGMGNYLQFLTGSLYPKVPNSVDEATSHAEIHASASR
jgi:hypothetical protein